MMVQDVENWRPHKSAIPSGWDGMNFDDVFEVISTNGKKVKQKDYLLSGALPVVDQGAAFIGGYTDDSENKITVEKPVIVFGDHTKCFKLIDFDFAPGADGTKILSIPNCIDSTYLYYLCVNLRLPDRGYSRHFSFLRKSILPIAPLNEQQRIVDKIERLFSKLDEGEALLKQVQQQLAVYRQSVLKAAVTGELTQDWREANQHRLESGEALLQRILQARRQQWQGRGKYKEPTLRCSLNGYWGWVEGPLEVFCGIKGGATVDAKRQLANPIEIPYLRVANVQDGFLDLAQVKTIRIEKSKLEELLLEKGDVLFTEGGDIDKLGRGWVWEGQVDLCTHQNHIFRGRPFSDDILSKFISFYCGSLGKEYFLEQGKQTTNLASISLTKLKAFPIALPSPAEQSEIINIVEDLLSRISTLETWCATELARSASLRQSILKDAFSGKLVEQDPNDEPASELLKRIQAAKAAVKKAPARKRQ